MYPIIFMVITKGGETVEYGVVALALWAAGFYCWRQRLFRAVYKFHIVFHGRFCIPWILLDAVKVENSKGIQWKYKGLTYLFYFLSIVVSVAGIVQMVK